MKDRIPDFFSYIVVTDSGFAPNPYGGICTLACSKPNIRHSANVGDWIIGTTPSPGKGRLVFAMRVEKGLTFDMYWEQQEYECKKPNKENGCGDNIYKRGERGGLVQVENQAHREAQFERDIRVNRVLISKNFYYFGKEAPEIPVKFAPLVSTVQGHKRIKPTSTEYVRVTRFLEWLQDNSKQGMNGEPGYQHAKCK
jgi:hypothetical protein